MDDDLNDWKEIATFVDRPVRTLQRWRKYRGFPVYSAHSGKRSPVIASKSEIRAWFGKQSKLSDAGSVPESQPTVLKPDELPASSLRSALLKLYYPDRDLQAEGLFRFSYVVNGRRVSTNIVTKRRWLNLRIGIDERDYDRFPLEAARFSWHSASKDEEEMLRRELEKKNIGFHNEPIFCLQGFEPSRRQIASFSVGQYVDYKIKLGRLDEEIAKALQHSDSVPEVAFKTRKLRMRLRNELLPDIAAMNRFDRLCAGGTNVLLAVRKPDDDGFIFFVKRRSGKVSTGRGLLSLLPSGMHQPTNKANAAFETSVAATVYRETYEELFRGEEVEGRDKHLSPLWYMHKAPLKWITEHRSRVITEVVSFGLNLIDGTYEFGVLLVINDKQYWDAFHGEMWPNQEFDDSETPNFSTLDASRLASLLTDPNCADTSLIALVEGLRRLKEIAPQRVNLPTLIISEPH